MPPTNLPRNCLVLQAIMDGICRTMACGPSAQTSRLQHVPRSFSTSLASPTEGWSLISSQSTSIYCRRWQMQPACPPPQRCPVDSRGTRLCTEGVSVLPLMSSPNTPLRKAAYSQWPHPFSQQPNIMGFSIRTPLLSKCIGWWMCECLYRPDLCLPVLTWMARNVAHGPAQVPPRHATQSG
eukprot:COSAG01_NODE_11160_length_1991_cov_1.678986_1_plen_180_part_10